MAKAFLGMNELSTQVSQVPTTQILEFASFEQVPHLLLRIELRRVARQALQMDPFAHRAGEKLFDHICTMDRRSIPNDQQRACDFVEQHPQKPHDILGLVGSLLHLHEQPSLLGDASNRGKMIARQLHAQDGSLSARRVGPYDHRQQIKARFINKN
jgi:hypothetical protein